MIDPINTGKLAKTALEKIDGPPAPDGPASAISEISGLDRETAEFLTKASGGELRAIFGTELRYIRLWRAIKVAEKSAKLLRARNREAQATDFNVMIPLLEAASLQDDEEMADLWAVLLANATDPQGSTVEPSFPDVLRQLASNDAQLLQYVVNRAREATGARWIYREFDRNEIKITGPISDGDDFMVSLDNLLRLRLLVSEPIGREQSEAGKASIFFDEDRIKLSAYGAKFARAVSRNEAD